MNTDFILFIVQIIAAAGVVISVVYLGIQIHQQTKLPKHHLGIHSHRDFTIGILILLKMLNFQNFYPKTGLVMI